MKKWKFTWLFAAVLAVSCGDAAVRMMGDAMVDAGEALQDAHTDAAAQPEMVQYVVTADQDSTRVVQGVIRSVSGGTPEGVPGPVFITDVHLTNIDSTVTGRGGTVHVAPDCGAGASGSPTIAAFSPGAGFSGRRIWVPAGQNLCVRRSADVELFYAGYRPYE